jgi:hypothetical protein
MEFIKQFKRLESLSNMPEKELKVEYGVLGDFPLPKTIYKYRDWEDDYHKRFITEREVFMASASSFEDELDCNNPTRFDLLSEKQVYDYFLFDSKEKQPNYTRQQHRNFARHWAKKSPIRDKKYVTEEMKYNVQSYYEHEGILSLTENCNNDEMWLKYANKERGFCVGYNTLEMFQYLGGGGEVEYVNKLPEIYPFPFMQSEIAMRNRAFFKLKKWGFEEEYRTKKFWPHVATIQDRQIKLPKEAFKHIILGNKISEVNEKELTESVKKHIGNIEIIKRKDLL